MNDYYLSIMKSLPVLLLSLLVINACRTKKEHNLFAKGCDELHIVFLKDSFQFQTFDAATIKNFVDCITMDNENFTDSCAITGQLIYKNKGKQLFAAQFCTNNSKTCNFISYMIDSKLYRHKLTYRAGMGIDEIYWHKVNAKQNPWPGVDTTKFRYDNLKNNP
jgi:hypothetical protein